MKCEECSHTMKCIDSRVGVKDYRRRRYVCKSCGHKVTSVEVPVDVFRRPGGVLTFRAWLSSHYARSI